MFIGYWTVSLIGSSTTFICYLETLSEVIKRQGLGWNGTNLPKGYGSELPTDG